GKGSDVGDARSRTANSLFRLDNLNRTWLAVERRRNNPRFHEYRGSLSADYKYCRLDVGDAGSRSSLVLLVTDHFATFDPFDLCGIALGRHWGCRILLAHASLEHEPAHVLVRWPHGPGPHNGLLPVAGAFHRGVSCRNSCLPGLSTFLQC